MASATSKPFKCGCRDSLRFSCPQAHWIMTLTVYLLKINRGNFGEFPAQDISCTVCRSLFEVRASQALSHDLKGLCSLVGCMDHPWHKFQQTTSGLKNPSRNRKRSQSHPEQIKENQHVFLQGFLIICCISAVEKRNLSSQVSFTKEKDLIHSGLERH